MSEARAHRDPPADEAALEERLSAPTEADIGAMAELEGDILVLGAGGKMGPSLARLARRTSDAAGRERRVIAASRFRAPDVADSLEHAGIEIVRCDLLDAAQLAALPNAANVVLMAGRKFGTADDPAATWAANAFLPGLVVQRFPTARLVVFSTGSVYPVTVATGPGCREHDPVGPVGDYAHSALARERIASYVATRQHTPCAIMRLNYAVELRYGVLRDLADRVMRGEPIDLTMGHVNVIWQRDANAIALRLLSRATVPPFVLNVTGPETLAVRALAHELAARLGTVPRFAGTEAPTALLSDASRARALFGDSTLDVATLCAWTAEWVRRGGASLGKPTRFEERGGTF
jgi:nucleoside-diphosphate-sugar epimerase